jgi:hypothetical protein
MSAQIIGSTSCTMASNAAVESPPVVNYTAVTRRAISVARRVIFLRTYFEHLGFVDPSSYLKEISDSLLAEGYDDANNSYNQVNKKLE